MTRAESPEPGNATTCPYCRAPAMPLLSAPDLNRRVSDVVFHLSRCSACGLSFVANPPADLAPYYVEDYHFIPDSAEALDPHLPGQRFKIDILRQYKESGALLEVGPSTGMFCRLAQLAGFDVSAIEFDAACTQYLNRHLGVRAVNSADPADVLAREKRDYDAICLWHSVEHLPAPWEVLEEAARRLRPDGVLLVAAPNPESWQAWLLGRRWPHHDLPRHLFALPIRWLLDFAREHGLRAELVTTRDEGSLYWNRFTWAMLARARSPHPRLDMRLWRWGLRFGRLLQPWEGREGKGATYTVVLRRTGS